MVIWGGGGRGVELEMGNEGGKEGGGGGGGGKRGRNEIGKECENGE